MLLSLSDKILTAYSGFTLKAFQPLEDGTSSNSYILLDAKANDYPFVVYGGGSISYTTGYEENGDPITESATKQFRVNWDGSLDAVGGSFKGAINATSGYITGNLDVIGSLKGGTISGATILGGTLDIGENITAAGQGSFRVASNGEFWATEGTIGGWKVTSTAGNQGFSYDGVGYMDSSGLGFGPDDKFFVDSKGNLYATSATFDTSLTVLGARDGDEVFKVYSDGRLVVHGNIYSGELNSADYIYMGTTSHKTSGILIYGNDVGLYSDQIWIGNDNKHTYVNGYMKVNASLGIGTDPDETGVYNLTINGSSKIDGDVLYTGEIYCTQKDDKHKGVSGTYKIETGWMSSKKLTFDKGILVKIGKSGETDEDDDDEVGIAAPPIAGNANKFLQVDENATAMQWTELGALAFKDSIKKKVNITMSGSYTVPMSGYYTRGSTGVDVCSYSKPNAAYKASTKYYYCKNGTIYGPYSYYSNIPSDRDDYISVFVADSSDANNYVVKGTEYTYYSTSEATDRIISLTGSKTLDDQEFEASDTDDDIDFTVSGITFTVPT